MFAGRGRWRARLGVFALTGMLAATGFVATSAPVHAVDGPAVTATPNTDLIAASSNTITVNGTGYEGAQAFNGVYVGLVSTADWVPGETPALSDFIGAAFVPKQAIVGGAFQTTVTVPANAVTDPDADYAIGSICAHACSLTDRSLDASTPVTFAIPDVTATPNTDLDAAVSNAITVNGTGYQGAQAFNGVYVGLVSTADWVPGETPALSDFIGAAFVPKQAIVGGAFQTTVTVPANAVTDPDADYAIGTICAHACSLTDRSLDASTPVTFVVPATAPAAPTAVGATGGVASATVSFTAPDDGGSPITQYDATCSSSNGGTTRSATGPASPIAVNALTSGYTYTCTVTATNAVGTSVPSAASSAFTTPAKPGAPTGATSRSGYTTAPTGALVVTYAAPASNGGRPITGYAATCTSSNGGVTKSGSLSGAAAGTITVAGATTGKTYTCVVTARNVVGTSVASVASLPVVLGSPVPPNGAHAVRAAAGQIRVTFTNAANNGAAIQSQTATCVSSNGGVTKTATHTGAAAAPITVTGLTAGKTYTCRVRATNARGSGQASAASNAVTA